MSEKLKQADENIRNFTLDEKEAEYMAGNEQHVCNQMFHSTNEVIK